MTRIYYHISTDQHNTYLNSLEEAKRVAAQWGINGDSNIRIFKTTKKEEDDEIDIVKELIPFNESSSNREK